MRLLRRVETDVLDDFSAYLTLELGRSPKTLRSYLSQLNAVTDLLGCDVVDVSVKDLRYRVKRDESASVGTRNLRLTAFKELHRWAGQEGFDWYNPNILSLRRIPQGRRIPKAPISFSDAQTLIDVCQSPNEYRVVLFGLYAGLRVMESTLICPDHVHGDRMTFVGKGDKERTVPVHPYLKAHLRTIFTEQPASSGVLQGVFNRLRKRYDIRDLKGRPATTHSLRRTFATFLYDHQDVPREVVKMLLGHGSEVTDLYAPVSFRRMDEAVHPIDYRAGEPVQLTLW